MTSDSPLGDAYSTVYGSLAALRETFHRTGRLDDSNAKLDEVAKLFATYLAYRSGLIPDFPSASDPDVVARLQLAFQCAAELPKFRDVDGTSIFGDRQSLALRAEDGQLAHQLTELVRDSIDYALSFRDSAQSFDVLNEAFGHFVRDNFRGNIEDAQYMTPPEVVQFMVDMVLTDIGREDPRARDSRQPWVVVDPSCGVGSFLAGVYQRAPLYPWLKRSSLRLFGQDKVQRMTRLATVNLELFNVQDHRIFCGNSLADGSALDELNGQADIILTNPPFGAVFRADYLRRNCSDSLPFFAEHSRPGASIDSELLFIDRNLRLLREGGRLVIVVPDGVVSAKGIAALLRQHLANRATLRAVVELPAVTFAQAGTRTKTVVLHIQKGRRGDRPPVFMGVSKSLGYQVVSRKGVQIKQSEGINDLQAMLDSYCSTFSSKLADGERVLSLEPSSVSVPGELVVRSSWTPGHYSAQRLRAISSLQGGSEAVDLVPLGELVRFQSRARRPVKAQAGDAFISVLHVLGEGFIDVAAATGNVPKTPGNVIYPGEILFSRINPRIPRVCITPDLGRRTLCSSEFEVLATAGPLDEASLVYLLQTRAVQGQIQGLTSGTSASHNRIRTEELARVLVPIPVEGSTRRKKLEEIGAAYAAALREVTEGAHLVATLRAREAELGAD